MKSLHLEAVHHINWLEYQHTLPDGRICIRLRTGRDDFARVTLWIADKYGSSSPEASAVAVNMTLAWRDLLFDYYQVIMSWKDPRISYFFALEQDGLLLFYDQDGFVTPQERENRDGRLSCFSLYYAYPAEAKPDWARGCVGYQIFPDRFRRIAETMREGGNCQEYNAKSVSMSEDELADKAMHEGEDKSADEARSKACDREDVEPWGSDRVQNCYRFGGNLAGIHAAVPYLASLGVDVVYMTPIFVSDTSHRYNTFDYYKIDPLLGTEAELRELVQALHARGMHLLLDGVFNHCGTDFAPFQDAIKRGKESPYYDWFFFDGEGGYQHFGSDGGMPKLNLRNEAAQQYFCEVGQYWIKTCGIDGWRLDVSTEVWPDFWRVYRKAIHKVNPSSLLVAECWDDSRHCITIGDMFDSTMHYVLSRTIWEFFAERTLSLAQFDARINRTMMMYPHSVQEVLWNFLGSHDTKRFLTRCGERMEAFKAGLFFQMTHPGVPIIYYGDELGMKGEDDPYCRHSMVWDQVEGNALLPYVKRLISLRHSLTALRVGTFHTHYVNEDTGLYAYLRSTDDDEALCVLCTGETAMDTMVPLPAKMHGLTTVIECMEDKPYDVKAGHVRIEVEAGRGFVFRT